MKILDMYDVILNKETLNSNLLNELSLDLIENSEFLKYSISPIGTYPRKIEIMKSVQDIESIIQTIKDNL